MVLSPQFKFIFRDISIPQINRHVFLPEAVLSEEFKSIFLTASFFDSAYRKPDHAYAAAMSGGILHSMESAILRSESK